MRVVRPGFAIAITLSITGCGDDPKPPSPGATVTPATPSWKTPDVKARMDAPPPVPGKLVMPERKKVQVDPAKQEAVKQRLLSLFSIVKARNFAEGASYLVYRGDDPARKRWHELCDYAKDKEYVDGMLDGVGRLLRRGEPAFVMFEARKESEGVWLAWFLTFGTKDVSLFACLEIDGTFAIGDID